MDKIIDYISIVANTLVVVLGWWILFRKAKPEIDKIKSESVSQAAQAAESFASATKTYSDELKKVRIELDTLKKDLAARDAIIVKQRITIEELRDWSKRLAHQIRSLNAAPVPYRQPEDEQTSK